jgi:hypothetical protein
MNHYDSQTVFIYVRKKSVVIFGMVTIINHFFFFFFAVTANDRGYGHWRFAGAFAVVERQGECGSKTAGMHVSQPMNIGVC